MTTNLELVPTNSLYSSVVELVVTTNLESHPQHEESTRRDPQAMQILYRISNAEIRRIIGWLLVQANQFRVLGSREPFSFKL